MNILLKIKNINTFSRSEQLLASYILKHAEEVLSLSTRDLAERCFVSIATIYRFLEKLEIKGYSEFKAALSVALVTQKEEEEFNFNFPIQAKETPFKVVQTMKEDYLQTINTTIDMLDLETLRQAVGAMRQAEIIDIYATAGNYYMAQNFKLQMLEIGVNVNVPNLVYEKGLQASMSDETHFAIVITYEGRGANIKEILGILRTRHTKILLISSPRLKEEADYHLYMLPEEHYYRKLSAFSSRLTT